jgi:NADPH:quinone reductase-like Zn-dependent oxidoreductase
MVYKRLAAKSRGGPEVLEFVRDPIPEQGTGELRIKILAAGVLLADVLWQTGKVPGSPRPPFTPGYDAVGIVEKVGDGVTDLRNGDTVAVLLQYGGYSEYVIAPRPRAVKVPSVLDPERVAALTVSYLTAYQIFNQIAKLKHGDRALVHGAAGGTGLAMLDVGRLMGVETYGTASIRKHESVRAYGGVPIDYQREDFVSRIFELTGVGVDLVVDPIGGSNLSRSFQVLRKDGVLVSTAAISSLIGDSNPAETILNMLKIPFWNLIPNGKRALLYDVVDYCIRHPQQFRENMNNLFKLLAEGQINPLIAKKMPLDEAPAAQRLLLESKVVGKIVLVME